METTEWHLGFLVTVAIQKGRPITYIPRGSEIFRRHVKGSQVIFFCISYNLFCQELLKNSFFVHFRGFWTNILEGRYAYF